MKKLQILAAIMAIGTMCVTGITACNMGGDTITDKTAPETRSIVVQDEGEQTPTPTPDDNCNGDNNCHRGKMPFKKPTFRFKAPGGKHRGNGRGKFRRPHKIPAPTPEPENPETPETPAENENN